MPNVSSTGEGGNGYRVIELENAVGGHAPRYPGEASNLKRPPGCFGDYSLVMGSPMEFGIQCYAQVFVGGGCIDRLGSKQSIRVGSRKGEVRGGDI